MSDDLVPADDFSAVTPSVMLAIFAQEKMTVVVDLSNGNISASSSETKFTPIHPHIFPHGGACMGNFTDHFYNIVASGNLSQVVDFVMEFFQSYNPSSPVGGGDWLSWSMALKYNTSYVTVKEKHHKEWEEKRKELAHYDSRYRNSDDEDEEEVNTNEPPEPNEDNE